jgi:hypothetical protein
MKILQLLFFGILISVSFSSAAEDVVSIVGPDCTRGIHQQIQGPFALHVFCDNALGTNVAVFMDDLGSPLAGNYYLGKRFWQGEEWNYDVTSYAWLKENYLLLATSHIYGSGAVYKLSLENQTYEIIRSSDNDGCVTQLISVQGQRVELGLTDCETLEVKIVEIAL